MRVKVTITAREAAELVVTSQFNPTADRNVTEAFNGSWTITQKENIFTFVHEWSTESPQCFELFAPF